jgi:hypothetical protein
MHALSNEQSIEAGLHSALDNREFDALRPLLERKR